MMISVMYRGGKICNMQVEPVGSADNETTCGSKCLVELVNGALILSTNVLSCVNGHWYVPKYVQHRETLSRSGYSYEGFSVDDGCTSWVEEKTDDCRGQYVLLSAEELEGALSISIDSVLMYVDEGDGLVSITGDGVATQEGPEVQKESLANVPKQETNQSPLTSPSKSCQLTKGGLAR